MGIIRPDLLFLFFLYAAFEFSQHESDGMTFFLKYISVILCDIVKQAECTVGKLGFGVFEFVNVQRFGTAQQIRIE